MSMTREQILAEAMALEPGDRETLAEQILLSLGPDEQAAIEAAWLAEARRREATVGGSGPAS
jgi:hypothetical protein